MTDSHTTTRRTDHRTNDSADWRSEYAFSGVALPDGGQYALPEPGAHVIDLDNTDDELVVLKVYPNTRADEHTIAATGNTVREHNEAYPADSPVVEVAYIDEVVAAGAEGDVEDLREAVQAEEIHTYAFPAERVERTAGGRA